jgi:dCTP deaminase
MLLKAEKIAKLLQEGLEAEPGEDPLLITPFPSDVAEDLEGAASIDLRLGTWFLTLRQARMPSLRVQRKKVKIPKQFTKTRYVPFGESYYLHPKSFALGITLEWVRMPTDLGGYVIGKSSWGRRGLVIATATGVHPGFKGCLTLELCNVGLIPIEIIPGMRICQLFLHRVETIEGLDTTATTGYLGQRRPVSSIADLKDDDFARKLYEEYRSTSEDYMVAHEDS